jgi:hypothetical protein
MYKLRLSNNPSATLQRSARLSYSMPKDRELPAVLEQFWEFDRRIIHERYLSLEEEMEG